MANATIQNDHSHDHHDQHVEELHTFGFWLYIMTDILLFATLFAAYIVLQVNVVPYEFDLKLIFAETVVLLTSSFTFGLAYLALNKKDLNKLLLWLAVTFMLGFIFICIELYEFHHLYTHGYGWGRNAYFSAFFTLVGTHGLHVFTGLVWLMLVFYQLTKKGITPFTRRKVVVLSLFWHFLDIVWIFVFSVVYLAGAL